LLYRLCKQIPEYWAGTWDICANPFKLLNTSLVYKTCVTFLCHRLHGSAHLVPTDDCMTFWELKINCEIVTKEIVGEISESRREIERKIEDILRVERDGE